MWPVWKRASLSVCLVHGACAMEASGRVGGIMGAPERRGAEAGLPLAGAHVSHLGGRVAVAGGEHSPESEDGAVGLEAVRVSNENSSGTFLGAPLP